MVGSLRDIMIICTMHMTVHKQLRMILAEHGVEALKALVRHSLKIVEMTRGSVSYKYIKAFMPLYPEPESTDAVLHLLLGVHIFTFTVFTRASEPDYAEPAYLDQLIVYTDTS